MPTAALPYFRSESAGKRTSSERRSIGFSQLRRSRAALCLPRHRAKEFIRFLKKINRAVAKHLDVHAICDNYKTHKTKEVQAWLAKHPRFKLHFTPTSSFWINLVERLFAEITRQQIRRGVFKSVAELEAAIETWLTERNAKPKPFKWTAKANIILEKKCTCQARWKKTSRRVLNE